jgi:hypothetical protein
VSFASTLEENKKHAETLCKQLNEGAGRVDVMLLLNQMKAAAKDAEK